MTFNISTTKIGTDLKLSMLTAKVTLTFNISTTKTSLTFNISTTKIGTDLRLSMLIVKVTYIKFCAKVWIC